MNEMETGVDPNSIGNAFSEKAIRQGFIKKVYSILSVQLIISFSAVLIGSMSEGYQKFAIDNYWIMFVTIIAALVLVIPMVCIKTLRRRTPHNYILLFTFTGLYSISLSFVGCVTDPEVVKLAVVITGIIVIGLTLFAIQTKIDFTVCNGIVVCLLLCLLISGITAGFYAGSNLRTINVVYGAIGALIASLFIVIDTQLIVGGHRSVQIDPEEYVYAALMIYLDIIRLFLYILQIVGNRS